MKDLAYSGPDPLMVDQIHVLDVIFCFTAEITFQIVGILIKHDGPGPLNGGPDPHILFQNSNY